MSPQHTIAHYRITAKLGEGGMGEVWRATDTKLGREVAIKILPAAFANDLDRMARFEREAHLLASLNHPNIATIYGIEQDAIVMELVDGEELKGPVPLDTALNYARQIAGALEAAHEKGIVHRDLKPANIKVTPDGVVKVLDFGLAKATDASASASATQSPTLSLAMTRAGVILGTAGYMAPEQARGKPIDRRADIWAFGAVLYEILAGRRSFDGETVTDVIAAVVNREPDWSALPASTPPHIRRLIERCLRKDVRTRLQAIGEARIAMDEPPAPIPGGAHPSERTPWIIAAAAVVVAVAGVIWGIVRRPQLQAATPLEWSMRPGIFRNPAVSRDGTRLLFIEDLPRPRLMTRVLRDSDAKPVPGGDDVTFAEFSPDMQWLVLETSDRKVKKIPAAGGDAITLAEPFQRLGVSWGDDNTIVYVGEHGLMRVSSRGGNAWVLTKVDDAKGETAHRAPHFLPGANALLFTVMHGSANQIAALNLKTGQWHVLVEDGFNGMYVPTGHLLFVRQSTLYAVPFDLKRLTVTGPEAPVITGLSSLARDQGEHSVSDNGLLVYMADGGVTGATKLGWMDRAGHVEPVSDELFWGNGRLSPDGRFVAIDISEAARSANRQSTVWVFDLQRRTKVRLADTDLSPGPIWTPDGRRITFATSAKGKSTIWWMPADGSAKPESILTFDGTASPNSWSPDGNGLFFTGVVGNQPSIWMAPFSGGTAGKPQRLHDVKANEAQANISPDGNWLAYASDASGQFGVYMVYIEPFPPRGGRELVSAGPGGQPRWSRDGKQLYYDSPDGWMAVDIALGLQPRLGSPRLLTQTRLGSTFDPAPDGKHFLAELTFGPPQRVISGITDWFSELRQKSPVR
jgi:sugar lactone lactonase YvrE/predicted Ser/Thr protein kinase